MQCTVSQYGRSKIYSLGKKRKEKKKIRQINFLEISLNSKNVGFTKFLAQKSESKFPKFPHCELCGNLLSHCIAKIREINVILKQLLRESI